MHNWSRFHRRGVLQVVVIAALNLAFATVISAAADRTRPTRPTNLRATQTTSASVSLAWDPSTDDSGSFSYILDELNTGQSRTLPKTQTTYAWTGLQPSRTYRFVIVARDAAGNQSLNSNTLTVTTLSGPPPAAPSNLRVTAAGLTSVSLAWDAVSAATGYQVSVIGGTIYMTGSLQPAYVVGGLNPGTSYQLAVRSQNAGGFSAWSSPVTATTPTDSTPPSVPFVSGSALSPGVVQLTWTESFDALSSVGYNVYVNGKPARSMLPHNTIPRNVVIHNLRASTSYEFTVKAYDSTGNFSAASPGLTLTTPGGTDAIAPATPPNLRNLGWGNGISSVGLGWDWAADNVGTMAYEVYVDNALGGEVLYDVHYPGVDTFITLRNIPPGTTHSFTVKARDEAGNLSAPSNPLSVTLLPSTDTTPPSAPVLLWGSTSPGCGFVDFSWTNAMDNVDTASQLEYEIYEDGLFRGVWRWEAFEASFGRHRFHLRALDRAGNRSAPSNEIVLDSGLSC